MFRRNSPHEKKSKWDVKEKLPTLKKEDNMGCVRETPEIKTKLAWDV